jgi:predicted enzyme related to lactoylglutathione lyase
MNSVVHFEIPYDDPERVAGFYHAAFGWETQALGERMGNYVLATTTETDSHRMPKEPGAINGGFYPKRPDWPAQYPSIVIAVDDLDKAIDRVTRAGGRVLGKPMKIPDVGTYVAFTDPEGNRISMLEPSRESRQPKQGEEPVSPRGPRTSLSTERSQEDWSPKSGSSTKEKGGRDRKQR